MVLIDREGEIYPCWELSPNNYWCSMVPFPTVDAARQHYRDMYPHDRRPDLWEQYPKVFGSPEG